MKKSLSAATLAVFFGMVVAIAAPAGAVEAGAKAAFDRAAHDFVTHWNAHDAKKMAAVWSDDADLVNPFNRAAKGRAEIEKLFTDEQGGPMKATTYKIESTSLREFGKHTAVGDWSGVVTGILGPDGKVQPPFSHHVTVVLAKVAEKWEAVTVRAYIFATTPPAPKAAKAAK